MQLDVTADHGRVGVEQQSKHLRAGMHESDVAGLFVLTVSRMLSRQLGMTLARISRR
jgi:hypothetical protein